MAPPSEHLLTQWGPHQIQITDDDYDDDDYDYDEDDDDAGDGVHYDHDEDALYLFTQLGSHKIQISRGFQLLR